MQTKKTIKAKNKRNPKKVVGTMQEINTTKIWEYLLYLPPKWTHWKQLANGSYVAQGKCGCIFEIRLKNTPTTMLQLQYKPWGKGCRLFCKNVKRNWAKGNGQVAKRPPSKCKSIRPLSKTNKRLSKYLGRTFKNGLMGKFNGYYH